MFVALQAINRTGKNGTFLAVARLGLERATVEVLFHEIGLCRATMSDKKEPDSHRMRTHSSACGIVRGIRDIRSGGLSLFLLCADANRI